MEVRTLLFLEMKCLEMCALNRLIHDDVVFFFCDYTTNFHTKNSVSVQLFNTFKNVIA
jgi:hypothetical protein